MKILLTGSQGQLGQEMVAYCHDNDKTQAIALIPLSHRDIELNDAKGVMDCIKTHQPQWVINCVAYTAVDKAEEEAEAAYAVNHQGVAHLAQACAKHQVKLMHLSTDYVFDGQKDGAYDENDKPNPLNVYGKSKLAGEQAIAQTLEQHLIVRVSWLFGIYGHNFVKTIIRLMREKTQLSVVSDQIGGPTPTVSITHMLLHCIRCREQGQGDWGLYHYSAAPAVSWYQFACAILDCAQPLLPLQCKQVRPILSREYKTRAARQANSRLAMDKMTRDFSLQPAQWQMALPKVIQAII